MNSTSAPLARPPVALIGATQGSHPQVRRAFAGSALADLLEDVGSEPIALPVPPALVAWLGQAAHARTQARQSCDTVWIALPAELAGDLFDAAELFNLGADVTLHAAQSWQPQSVTEAFERLLWASERLDVNPGCAPVQSAALTYLALHLTPSHAAFTALSARNGVAASWRKFMVDLVGNRNGKMSGAVLTLLVEDAAHFETLAPLGKPCSVHLDSAVRDAFMRRLITLAAAPRPDGVHPREVAVYVAHTNLLACVTQKRPAALRDFASAAARGPTWLRRVLLDTRSQGSDSLSLLEAAARGGHPDIMAALLQALEQCFGAYDLEDILHEGLSTAAASGDVSIFNTVWAHTAADARANYKINFLAHALMSAAKAGHQAMVAHLADLSHFATLYPASQPLGNLQNKNLLNSGRATLDRLHVTALGAAAGYGQHATVVQLLHLVGPTRAADLIIGDASVWPAVMLGGNLACLELLLAAVTPDVASQGLFRGPTRCAPLLRAMRLGHDTLCARLVRLSETATKNWLAPNLTACVRQARASACTETLWALTQVFGADAVGSVPH